MSSLSERIEKAHNQGQEDRSAGKDHKSVLPLGGILSPKSDHKEQQSYDRGWNHTKSQK
jgi:hypothetical protein